MINRRSAVLALASAREFVFVEGVLACSSRSLRFSDTQQLDPADVQLLRTRPLESDSQKLVDALRPPPASTEAVCAELERLHALARLRPEYLLDIRAEVEIENFRFDGIVLGAQTVRGVFPITLKLLSQVLFMLEPLIHTAKLRFDRIRPSLADPTLTTALPVPGHPAFPSGHACQATTVAILLSRLAPGRREFYAADAQRITANREIAGLHYPSDGLAGGELARSFIDWLDKDDWFGEMMALSALEWKT